MADEFPDALRRELTRHGQEHVLRRWDTLTPASAPSPVGTTPGRSILRELESLVADATAKGRRPAACARRTRAPRFAAAIDRPAAENGRRARPLAAGPSARATNCCGPARWARFSSPADRGRVSASTNRKACFPSVCSASAPLFQILAAAASGPLASGRRVDSLFHHDERRDSRTKRSTFSASTITSACRRATCISSSRAICPQLMPKRRNS